MKGGQGNGKELRKAETGNRKRERGKRAGRKGELSSIESIATSGGRRNAKIREDGRWKMGDGGEEKAETLKR
jgi:hypothetical protein